MADYKVLFLGPGQSGQATAIQTLTGAALASTEFRMADYDSPVSSGPSFDLLFAGMSLGDGDSLYLFKLAEATAPEPMLVRLASRFLAVCVLINNGAPRPLDELALFLDAFDEIASAGRLSVGVTHMDRYATTRLQDYRDYLAKQEMVVPVFEIDARDRRDVATLVQAVIYSSATSGFSVTEDWC